MVGNLTDYRASQLRTIVYSRSMNMLRLDTAQAICEALLRHDSIKEDIDQYITVIDLLINVCRLRSDNEQLLHWATEKANLCREQAKSKPTDAERAKAETEALRTEVEIGIIQIQLGQRDEGLARINYIIDRLDRPGSVNRFDALMIALKRKINALQELGRYADVIPVAHLMFDRLDHFASLDYRRRYEALTDTLYTRLLESKANDYAARYKLQEQRMEEEQLRARNNRGRLIVVLISIALLMALAALVWYGRQQRIISRKNRSLVDQISEAIKYKRMYENLKSQVTPPEEEEAIVEESAGNSLESLSHDQLFDHIRRIIKRKKLYLHPTLNRQAVIDHLHLSKERIGQAFSQGSDYSSITHFINDCRLEHACQLLVDTDKNIDDIAAASGFSVRRTFSRLFKEKYGLTPSEYREQNRQG